MKQAVFVVLVALVAITKQQGMSAAERQQKDANEAACTTAEKPSQADIEMFRKRQVPTTQAGKCFVGCVFEKMGIIKNGSFSRANADTHANQNMKSNPTMLANVLKSNKLCESEVGTGTDKCVTGPKLMTCMLKNMPPRPTKP